MFTFNMKVDIAFVRYLVIWGHQVPLSILSSDFNMKHKI